MQKINIAKLLKTKKQTEVGELGKNIFDAMLTELRNRLLLSKRENGDLTDLGRL